MIDQPSCMPHSDAPAILVRLWNAPYLLLGVATFLWASNFVVGRVAPPGLPPISLDFWRWTLAAPIALALALPHLRRDMPMILRTWPLLLVLAATGLAGSNLLAYIGLRTTPATLALLIQSVLPVTILALSQLIFKERSSRRQVLACGLATLGVITITGLSGSFGAAPLGAAAIIGAMISQAIYVALLRRRPQLHPTTFLFVTIALAVLVLAPLQLLAGVGLPLSHPSPMAAVLYIACGPSVAAFFLFNRAVALIGPGRASLGFYLLPVFGGLLAMPLLGETLGLNDACGFALIGAAFALAVWQRRTGPAN